jgi:hypothetical protein
MKKVTILSIITLSLFFFSCKKDNSNTLLSATLKGNIKLADSLSGSGGIVYASNCENVIIKVTGFKEYSGTTNSGGNYQIENIETGTYNISIEKPGYKKYTCKSYQVVGGNKPIYFDFTLYNFNLSYEYN